MTFLQLEYFHAVAESGSISRVAEQYNISPAALSRSISQLERELGTELFDHEGRSIVLNMSGKVFMECTAEILDAMLLARKRIANENHRRLVRVRLDVIVDEPGELPIAFKLARPDLLVEVVAPYRSNLRYDIRVFATTSIIDDPRYELICSERYVAALPIAHPLAGRKALNLSELKDELFIIYKSDQHEQTVFEMCKEIGFVPKVGMTFGLTERRGVYRALCEGLGCSLVPAKVSRAEWDTSKVALVPLSDIEHMRYIYVATANGEPMDDDCRFVVDVVKGRLDVV